MLKVLTILCFVFALITAVTRDIGFNIATLFFTVLAILVNVAEILLLTEKK